MLDKILTSRLFVSVGESLGLKKTAPTQLAGQSLYAQAVAQSRQIVFYTDYGVPDEIGARFEILVLHVLMLTDALKSEELQRRETSQALFDALMQALDDTLREQGIGDLSVPKKMKKLGQEVYTRMVRWDEMWEQDAPTDAQADYLRRTLYAGQEEAAALPLWSQALAHYINDVRAALRADRLTEGQADWPAVKSFEVKET